MKSKTTIRAAFSTTPVSNGAIGSGCNILYFPTTAPTTPFGRQAYTRSSNNSLLCEIVSLPRQVDGKVTSGRKKLEEDCQSTPLSEIEEKVAALISLLETVE